MNGQQSKIWAGLTILFFMTEQTVGWAESLALQEKNRAQNQIRSVSASSISSGSTFSGNTSGQNSTAPPARPATSTDFLSSHNSISTGHFSTRPGTISGQDNLERKPFGTTGVNTQIVGKSYLLDDTRGMNGGKFELKISMINQTATIHYHGKVLQGSFDAVTKQVHTGLDNSLLTFQLGDDFDLKSIEEKAGNISTYTTFFRSDGTMERYVADEYGASFPSYSATDFVRIGNRNLATHVVTKQQVTAFDIRQDYTHETFSTYNAAGQLYAQVVVSFSIKGGLTENCASLKLWDYSDPDHLKVTLMNISNTYADLSLYAGIPDAELIGSFADSASSKHIYTYKGTDEYQSPRFSTAYFFPASSSSDPAVPQFVHYHQGSHAGETWIIKGNSVDDPDEPKDDVFVKRDQESPLGYHIRFGAKTNESGNTERGLILEKEGESILVDYPNSQTVILKGDHYQIRNNNGRISFVNFNDLSDNDPLAPDLFIRNIADQTLEEDSVIKVSIPFHYRGSTEDLIFHANSSNPEVIPDANLSFEGQGANRQLKIVPALNQSGPVTLSVYITNYHQTASMEFKIDVLSKNDVPVLTEIPEQFLNPKTHLEVPLFVRDEETSQDQLNYRVISSNPYLFPNNAGIEIKTVGATKVLSLQPQENKWGDADITVEVFDGTDTTQQTFKLHVFEKAKGDLNGDGTLDSADVADLQRFLNPSSIHTASAQPSSDLRGDLDNDGKVDYYDLYRLQELVAGKIASDMRLPVRYFQLDVNGDEFYSKKTDVDYKNNHLKETGGSEGDWTIDYQLKGNSRLQHAPIPPFNMEFKKSDEFPAMKNMEEPEDSLLYKKIRVVNAFDYWGGDPKYGAPGTELRETFSYAASDIFGVPAVNVVGFAYMTIVAQNSGSDSYETTTIPVLLIQRDNQQKDEQSFASQNGYGQTLMEANDFPRPASIILGDGISKVGYQTNNADGTTTDHLFDLDINHSLRYELLKDFLETQDRDILDNEDYAQDQKTEKWKAVPFDFDDALCFWGFEPPSKRTLEKIETRVSHFASDEQLSQIKQTYYDMAKEIFNDPKNLYKLLDAADRFPFTDANKNEFKTYIKGKFYAYAIYFGSQDFATKTGHEYQVWENDGFYRKEAGKILAFKDDLHYSPATMEYLQSLLAE